MTDTSCVRSGFKDFERPPNRPNLKPSTHDMIPTNNSVFHGSVERDGADFGAVDRDVAVLVMRTCAPTILLLVPESICSFFSSLCFFVCSWIAIPTSFGNTPTKNELLVLRSIPNNAELRLETNEEPLQRSCPSLHHMGTVIASTAVLLQSCGFKNADVISAGEEARTIVSHWHAHAVRSLTFTRDGVLMLSGGEEVTNFQL
jgi:hypothetical protein